MLLEGDTSVIDALKEKKRLLENGEDASHLNILCIFDGGLMKGAYATGAAVALEKLGYTHVFDSVVGVSSGAPAAAYFLAGGITHSSSLIYEECCSKQFINLRRFWSPLNAHAFIEMMRAGKKQLNWEAVKKSPTNLYIGVAHYENATPHLIQATDFDHLLKSTEASISIPTMAMNTVIIDGERYTDGGFTDPHILEHILRSIDHTHALVFTSQDKGTADIPWSEKLLNNTLLRNRYSTPLRKAANNRRTLRHAFIDSVVEKALPVCFVWGDNSVSSNERNPEKVKTAVLRWRDKWLDLLG